MSALSRMLREATILHVVHERRCPDCAGRGENPRPLPGPDGKVPFRRAVVARVQCSTCKGAGKVVVGEESREKGVVTLRDARGVVTRFDASYLPPPVQLPRE